MITGWRSYRVINQERGIGSHQEVQARLGDQGGDQAHQVVVGVPGISHGGRGGGHHRGDDRVDLTHRRSQQMKTVCRDAV